MEYLGCVLKYVFVREKCGVSTVFGTPQNGLYKTIAITTQKE
jgi:hypothetical protein